MTNTNREFGVKDPDLAKQQEREARVTEAREEYLAAKAAREAAEADAKKVARRVLWRAVIFGLISLAAIIASMWLVADALFKILNGDVTQPTLFSLVFWSVMLWVNLRPSNKS